MLVILFVRIDYKKVSFSFLLLFFFLTVILITSLVVCYYESNFFVEICFMMLYSQQMPEVIEEVIRS